MPRLILDESEIHPSIRAKVADNHRDLVEKVIEAMKTNDVVVAGMAQNPHCRHARKILDAKGARYAYIEEGSYLSAWRRRNALKMWSGWPTFPMVFVKGTLVGGADDLNALVKSGEFDRLIAG